MTDQATFQPGDFIVPPITPAQANAARNVTAAHARDADDYRALIAALGLEEL